MNKLTKAAIGIGIVTVIGTLVEMAVGALGGPLWAVVVATIPVGLIGGAVVGLSL